MSTGNPTTVDRTRVFVVHGRNEELRLGMFDFLRSIGLKPIEWSQAVSMTQEGSPYIGDILDTAMQYVQAVVVLFSGDDEARLREEFISESTPEYEKNLSAQARPNVIFEAGMAFGRFPRRAVLVEVGNLRPFSDIAGRHTIRLNNTTKSRQELAQRLSTAGCSVDLSGTDWHTTGNFNLASNNHKINAALQPIQSKKDLPPLTQPQEQENFKQILVPEFNQILKNAAKYSDSYAFTRQLYDGINLHPLKLKVLINNLVNLGYLTGGYSGDGDWKLTEKGVAYLIEKDLI